ncbi:hypothetical protein LEP1GSC051_3995 [Leptospira sp. P2653]|nr:hypothetical protein [Leptospira sp. P2653]EMJ65148.1 hypothetical protein LEP1GSC051_3995 [Leptospira sp. P2653]
MKTELGHLDIPEKMWKRLLPLLPKIKTNRLKGVAPSSKLQESISV